jgi:hypothetical protein
METSWHESFADRYAEWPGGRTAGEPFTGERTEHALVAPRRHADD